MRWPKVIFQHAVNNTKAPKADAVTAEFSYLDTLKLLEPAPTRSPLVVDLFAGCGGLALGFEAQGFETHGFEMHAAAVATYRRNLRGECSETRLSQDSALPEATVLVGGPPCQPFSVGGNQLGLKDSRDGFPIFLSAVRRLRPEIFMFENVRGMFYRNRWYLDEVLDALRAEGYIVEARLLNAIDHGVPQNRERLVAVGHRGDFRWPEPNARRITAGEALGTMAFEVPDGSRFLTPSMDKYVLNYEVASKCVRPRDLHLEKPARTVTCRNLAGATGDMQRVRLPDGRRRRLVPREAARLQSFPDCYEFAGSETEQFNQIGNAVAPMFAYHLAAAVRAYLERGRRLSDHEVTVANVALRLAHPSMQHS